MSLRTWLGRKVFSSTLVRACSTAAENARIIDEDGPDLPQRLLDCFVKLERLNDDTFRSIHLLRGRKSFPHIYGGQVVAHALKSATETVDSSLSPHSTHCYFVKAGAVSEPVDFHVERIRNGRSFATRLVRAMQNNEILFTSQVSFQNVRTKGTDHLFLLLKMNPFKVFFGIYATSYVSMSLPDCHLLVAQRVRIHRALLATPIFRRDPNATPPINLCVY
ncbi:hypothetical protein Y032_0028g1792 [Ancylostoma ceylanicum]|uniref:Acyl-CoA thioesterase-like N-terminal HotDog domain-containing protein n=1 Tax=Ancylostoma ceylanicum TaxID=53326 RepID=A0A016USA1_9BILA|nr:hypothetical protein Y032_0028g1792 [Ancylostoma ceylanicum]